MRCSECRSEKVVKDRNNTKLHRPSHVKQKAIELYINGMSINAISKVLNIPYMTVMDVDKQSGVKSR